MGNGIGRDWRMEQILKEQTNQDTDWRKESEGGQEDKSSSRNKGKDRIGERNLIETKSTLSRVIE